MKRPYHRTLWIFLQLKEQDRIDELMQRGRTLNNAGLTAIAFHEPKKLADEHHSLMKDLGMVRSPDEALANAADVIDVMARIHAGEVSTTTSPSCAPDEEPS